MFSYEVYLTATKVNNLPLHEVKGLSIIVKWKVNDIYSLTYSKQAFYLFTQIIIHFLYKQTT